MASSVYRRSGSNRQAWRRWYTQRIKDGREHCRMCGRIGWHITQVRGGLRFGHIRAAALGGRAGIENTTIVCGGCDAAMGAHDWTGTIPALCDEPAWPATQAKINRWIRRREMEGNRRAASLA